MWRRTVQVVFSLVRTRFPRPLDTETMLEQSFICFKSSYYTEYNYSIDIVLLSYHSTVLLLSKNVTVSLLRCVLSSYQVFPLCNSFIHRLGSLSSQNSIMHDGLLFCSLPYPIDTVLKLLLILSYSKVL